MLQDSADSEESPWMLEDYCYSMADDFGDLVKSLKARAKATCAELRDLTGRRELSLETCQLVIADYIAEIKETVLQMETKREILFSKLCAVIKASYIAAATISRPEVAVVAQDEAAETAADQESADSLERQRNKVRKLLVTLVNMYEDLEKTLQQCIHVAQADTTKCSQNLLMQQVRLIRDKGNSLITRFALCLNPKQPQNSSSSSSQASSSSLSDEW